MFVLLQKKILNASLLVSKYLNVKYGICESCSSNIEKGIDFSFIFSWKIEQNTNIAFFDQPFPVVYIKQLLLKNNELMKIIHNFWQIMIFFYSSTHVLMGFIIVKLKVIQVD